MTLENIVLSVLSFVLILGTPIYVYYRNRMVESATTKTSGYTKFRVVRLTLFNITATMTFCGLFMLLYLSIVNFTFPQDLTSFILSFLLFTTLGLCFYGAGIYITSIVLEAFTLPNLKKITSYKTQFIATHLFHGPISHVLVYSGFIFALLILSLLEFSTTGTVASEILLILAIPTGIMYAFAQIYNQTYPYQLVTAIFSLAALLIYKSISLKPFGAVGSYFLVFDICLVITLFVYFVYQEADLFFRRKKPRRTASNS